MIEQAKRQLAVESRVHLWEILMGLHGEMDSMPTALVNWADSWIATTQPLEPLIALSLESRILADTLYPLRSLSANIEAREVVPTFAERLLTRLKDTPALLHRHWAAFEEVVRTEDFPAEQRAEVSELGELTGLVCIGAELSQSQFEWFRTAFSNSENIVDEEVYGKLLSVILEKWRFTLIN